MIIDTSKPVDRTGNTFCGPLVVAAILGTSTGTVVSAIAAERQSIGGVVLANGKKRRVRARTADAIKGTWGNELFAQLTAHGFTATPAPRKYQRAHGRPGRANYVSSDFKRMCTHRPLFAAPEQWLPCTIVEQKRIPLWQWLVRADDATHIVHLPGHWAIYSAGKWCETYTGGAWVDKYRVPKSRRLVINTWQIERVQSWQPKHVRLLTCLTQTDPALPVYTLAT